MLASSTLNGDDRKVQFVTLTRTARNTGMTLVMPEPSKCRAGLLC
jgi:hypothetical protein